MTTLPALHTLTASVFPPLLRARLRQTRHAERTQPETQRRLRWEVPLLQLIVEWETRHRAGLLNQEAANRILTAIPALAHTDHARYVAETGFLWDQSYLPPTGAQQDPPLPPLDEGEHL